LVNYSSISANANALSEVRINSAAAGAGSDAWFRSLGNTAGSSNTARSGIGYDSTPITSTSGSGSNELVIDTTYMILSSYSNVGGTGASTATQWVLTVEQYNNFKAAEFDITNLNARTAGTGAGNIYSKVTDDSGSAFGFSGNSLYLQLAGNSDLAVYDEIRFATSLLDVVTPIPEPGSLTLAGLSALALLRRRR
jgi:uncharacterized protein (TIGR03382 family)